jgi:hypothetical protein
MTIANLARNEGVLLRLYTLHPTPENGVKIAIFLHM